MDRDNITKSVGFSYILLGVYYFSGSASIDKQTIASLSVSAFLFILSDYLQVLSEKHSDKNTVSALLHQMAITINTAAIVIMLAFPFLEITTLTEKFYDVLGTTTLLVGLGVSIYLIAKKNEIKDEKFREEVRQTVKEVKVLHNDATELNREAKEIIEELTTQVVIHEESMSKK